MSSEEKRIVVTGGAGFLGSEFIREWIRTGGGPILNIDLLTYAGNTSRLAEVSSDPRYNFLRADIRQEGPFIDAVSAFRPDLLVHFAAESHVTRGERDPQVFFSTNVEGTRAAINAAKESRVSRMIHISTDEVYGPIESGSFREEDKKEGDIQATTAYAKSKSLGDDLARSSSSELDIVVVRPTNCFGSWQHPEKAFPRWISRGLLDRPLLVWGDGLYVRQWLFSNDLARAIRLILDAEHPQDSYNVGPRHDPEIANLDLARWLAGELGLPPDRIVMTAYDRPQHDRRYCVEPARIESLGWRARDVWESFATTVRWYQDNRRWWKPLLEESESIYIDERK